MSIQGTPLRALAAAALLAALAACADQPEPTAAGGAAVGPGGDLDATATAADIPDTTVAPPPDGDLFPGEQEFVELSKEIPGFAGYHYEGDTRVVSLTDPGQQDRAAAALDAREKVEPSAHDEAKSGGGTRFVKADYDYPTLRAWRDKAAEGVLSVDGVAYLDLDEVRNRIAVGVADDKAAAAVADQLKAAGVPAEATIVDVEDPVQLDQLSGFFRPLQGGWQIQNGLGALPCTLGFVTTYPPNGQRAFVTASHCTQIQWGLDGISFYQPTAPAFGNFVGREVRDPRGWPCYVWRVCRWSDAALVQVANATAAPNQVRTTTFFNFGWLNGSVIPAASLPVASYLAAPPAGAFLDKVGRQTGWNYGPVNVTCALVTQPPNRVLGCQYAAFHKSDLGDSGAPVFIWYGTFVRVVGITWGHVPGVRSWFSPIGTGVGPNGGIRADLGVP